MGDFNVDTDNPAMNSQSRPAKMRFISQLQELDLVDSYTLTGSDNLQRPYQHTWHNAFNTITSRIDYIWCSLPLLSNFVYHSSFNTELYQSDHCQLVLFLDKRSLFLSANGSTNKKPQLHKLQYHYDRMDLTLWDSFSVATDAYASSNPVLSGLKENSIRTIRRLNSVWDNLRTCIITAAKAHIPSSRVNSSRPPHLSKPLTKLQYRIKSINKIYYQFRAFLLKQQL